MIENLYFRTEDKTECRYITFGYSQCYLRLFTTDVLTTLDFARAFNAIAPLSFVKTSISISQNFGNNGRVYGQNFPDSHTFICGHRETHCPQTELSARVELST